MLRTVSVHLQEQSFYKLNVVFGMCGYTATATKRARRIRTYLIRHSAYKQTAPEGGLM